MLSITQKALKQELKNQKRRINLIASENYVSKRVLKACGSCIQNKYCEGEVNNRYYMGCENADIIEERGKTLIKQIFNCKFVNLQPHSGSQANLAAYMSICKYLKEKPENIIGIGFELTAGGHLTHFNKMAIAGNLFESYTYGLTESELIDYDKIELLLEKFHDKNVILNLGYSAYSHEIDYSRLSSFIRENNLKIFIIHDISHISGLIAAKLFKNPLDYDWGQSISIITSTTHKTLRCARHAFIATNDYNMAKCIDKAVFPYLQGGPLMNMIAGVVEGLEEVNSPKFIKYQNQVLKNMKALIKGIEKNSPNLRVVSKYSDNHLCLLDLNKTKYNGKEAEELLAQNNIICNRNTILGDSALNPMGIRLGTVFMTSRGWKERKFYALGKKIARILY